MALVYHLIPSGSLPNTCSTDLPDHPPSGISYTTYYSAGLTAGNGSVDWNCPCGSVKVRDEEFCATCEVEYLADALIIVKEPDRRQVITTFLQSMVAVAA